MTAQEKLTEFCSDWSRKDYAKMYIHCTHTWRHNHTKNNLKDLITVKIKSFKIIEIKPVNDCMVDIDLEVSAGGEKKKLTCRLIREVEPYRPLAKGDWGVNPVSLIRNLY